MLFNLLFLPSLATIQHRDFMTLLIRRKENTNMDQQHIMIEAVRQPVRRRNN